MHKEARKHDCSNPRNKISSSETNPKDTEECELSGKELKVTNHHKDAKELRKIIQKQKGNINKEKGTITKNQTEILDMENTVTELKNSLESFKSRLDQPEERVSKL